MLITLVHVHVKTEQIAAFIEATIENARNSVLEPGIARFDFIQQSDDPTRFVLIEVFRDADAPNKHRETAHYLKWRDTVADMLAEPRVGIRHINVFPDDEKWG
jgi:quinol monooxygenase YgiN